jgi:two-component system chemotaxis sensor kinase CheA
MVRNAVDHGIGPPEEREKQGKPSVGTVELSAYHSAGNVVVEIRDDGRGIDRDAVLGKARERGLVTDGSSLSDREIFNLIFEPGFSTAKAVTDVSGRGVGMDVVKRNIEQLRGQVEIQSEIGRGSIFQIRLPLTLAIIDGMVIRVGGERYIIPTASIVRTIKPKPEELSTVLNKGEMLSLGGNLIPLLRLSDIYHIEDALHDPTEGLAVVVDDNESKTGLLADELLGQQQIVIKALGESMKDVPGISGGAIMADGHVSLILDVGGLVRLANEGNGERTREEHSALKETMVA